MRGDTSVEGAQERKSAQRTLLATTKHAANDIPPKSKLFDGNSIEHLIAFDGTFRLVFDGAVDETLDGTFDGALDGTFDGAFDGALDGAVDGAFDGTLNGTFVNRACRERPSLEVRAQYTPDPAIPATPVPPPHAERHGAESNCVQTCLFTCLHTCLYKCLHTCLYTCLHTCLFSHHSQSAQLAFRRYGTCVRISIRMSVRTSTRIA